MRPTGRSSSSAPGCSGPLTRHRSDQPASPRKRFLGADADPPRTDHEAPLQPGDTVVLCTDWLVEHGCTRVDEAITRLTAQLAALAELPLEALCDTLLDRMAPGHADDDIALLAVRTHPATSSPRHERRRPGMNRATAEHGRSTRPPPTMAWSSAPAPDHANPLEVGVVPR